ncbi:MAG: sensor histidine kinase [Bacteroidota bacterium]
MMAFVQKHYKSLLIGGLISIGLVFTLRRSGFMLFEPSYVSPIVFQIINILAILLCWGAISFFIEKFSVYKVLAIFSCLLIGGYLDTLWQPFNPVSIPLIILFWIGIVSLILPHFYNKYRVAILTVYGLVISYFVIFRMLPDYQEEHHQTFLNFMIMPLPVFAALWGYEQWRGLRTLQIDKGKAELALLKSQINPHFFFNTLNNLYGLVVEKSDEAPGVVLKLSEMMRYTIYNGREEFVSLDDEVTYLENYIDLHKIRYQKKVSIDFQKEIAGEYKVAPLLFIILLENAFKHGVEGMTDAAYVRLHLSAKDHQLNFVIENNFEEQTSKGPGGIGLENLRKRLDHIYPRRHELRIEQQFPLYKVNLSIQLS